LLLVLPDGREILVTVQRPSLGARSLAVLRVNAPDDVVIERKNRSETDDLKRKFDNE